MYIELPGDWATRYAAEAADQHCLHPSEMHTALKDSGWERVLAVGDSVAAGVREACAGYEDLGGFDRLARALQGPAGQAYANLGYRGATTADVIRTQLPAALSWQPHLVVVAVGGNDALSRRFDSGRFTQELTDLVAPMMETGADVVVIGLFDLARSGLLPTEVAGPMADRFDQLDAASKLVADSTGALFVDNHHHPMAPNQAIFASDLMHCNARGHAISAATLTSCLSTAVQRRRDRLEATR